MDKTNQGFTLIETLVAISILVVAIVAPMSLATQSLSSAFYARDQVTAFHLAQEAIEAVRSIRDGNILKNAYGEETDLMGDIPTDQPFIIDTRDNSITSCTSGICPQLKSDGNFYAYGADPYDSGETGWTTTRFTRTINAAWVNVDNHDEMRVSVTVAWKTGVFQARTFTISQDLYRWVNDGTASQ